MEKAEIIRLKLKNWTDTRISNEFGVSRNTVRKYWNEYQENQEKLCNSTDSTDARVITEAILAAPKYDSSNRAPKKFTPELEAALLKILEEEEEKSKLLGPYHKQQLTNVQIHQLLIDQGFDISRSTISAKIKEIRDESKEAYIKQDYEYGERFEFDFGEVKLYIADKLIKAYLAVIACPASHFRWAYLYHNQKMAVFLDSQVRFFEMVGGCFKEGVYDNMRNAVVQFTGPHEKKMTQELINISLHYGFAVNLTNCRKGNEKGTVEASVKWIRNKTFAKKYRFASFEEAEQYLQDQLIEINKDSTIEEEMLQLSPKRPRYEVAKYVECTVDKYAFIHVDHNCYSVPENLVQKKVNVKLYPNELIVLFKGSVVAQHTRDAGIKKTHIDIRHYLHTLTCKPGALRNSEALKSNPDLYNLYNTYYKDRPKLFIELMRENKDLSYEELIAVLTPDSQENIQTVNDNIAEQTSAQIAALNALFTKGGDGFVS